MTRHLPDMSHDARLGLIFDMDDTLAATSHIWQQAERGLLASIGCAWDAALAGRYKGMNALDLSAVIHRELRPTVELAALQQRMRGLLIDAFAAGEIAPMPGSVELVRRAQSRGRLAVASGSPLPVIEGVLDRLGIADAFDVVLSSESIARGKPHPDVFLAAAERLGVDPASCVVFEDSLVGAQAARAAGMPCFVVPSLANPAIAATATTVYASWHDVGASHLMPQVH